MARIARRAALALGLIVCCLSRIAWAQIEMPPASQAERIIVSADSGSHWVEGAYHVYLLRGNCLVQQGATIARSKEAVLWIEAGAPRGDPPNKIIAFLEGDVEIVHVQPGAQGNTTIGASLRQPTWFGRFFSVLPVEVRPIRLEAEPSRKSAVYQHALAARDPNPVKPAQFAEPVAPPPPVLGPPPGMLRVSIHPRSAVRPEVEAFVNPNTNESVVMAKLGVNITVDGLDQLGSFDVDTDNLVVWTDNPLANPAGESLQSPDARLELYLEGNVVFRQGERTIYAQRMYYDVRRRVGVVLQAEILTPVPSYEGLLRLRAEVIQQLGPDQFVAQHASLTSSRLGVPTYDLRADTITFDDFQRPRINPFTGQPEIDLTGSPIVDHQKQATSRGNAAFIGDVPVFYWPWLATDLEKPNFFIDSLRVTNDNVFGTRVMVDLDAYQLLGIRNRPPGTKWQFSTDYFSARGPAGGTTFNYERQTLFGVPDSTSGFLDAWVIQDHGLDNLGSPFRALEPEKDFRGRLLVQHRQLLPEDFQLTGEIGLISDRNFLEQYFEREWDQLKDQSTDLELKRFVDNSTWSLFVSGRLNPFFTETQWLPRADHFWLGQSLLQDRLTWYEHSSIGYGQFKSATAPLDPQQAALWGPLPWEAPAASTREGGRYSTRQELDLPFSLGVVRFDPYVAGEFTRWDETLTGDAINRAVGTGGLRASMPMWSVNPGVESDLFNLHGLAHKVVFEADAFYTQSNANLEDLPLYDPIDDNNIEAYRRFFPFFDFGGPPPVPTQFDERFYALRRGLGSWVASPSTEIADDLFAARLGVRQRWQTKRGPIGNQRIVDWILLNTNATVFPDPDRDNFGEVLGLLDYDFRWHVGDRTTLVSEGYFDFYSQAPKYITVGAFLNRPPRASFYLGLRSMEGPITSNVLATSYSYRMSPKWLSSFGTTFNLSEGGNIGQNFTVTRIGESFLLIFNVNVDASKGSVGANFAIQPRFLQGRLGPGPALAIPVAGAYGLE